MKALPLRPRLHSTPMTLRRISTFLLAAVAACLPVPAQDANPPLTVDQACAMALKNHPQILASQAISLRATQLTREERSANYPTLNGDVTASQAELNSRIGAGFLTDSRLFNRAGAGVTLSQLITDLGRTHNLIASSGLRAQASQQDYQATRYDVISGVEQSYYDVLLSQQLVKLSEETVKSRQTIVDQISELAKNKLKSDVDVSFVQVNLTDAKLMLLRAQDRLKSSYAALAQALGTQQYVEYALQDAPMPPAPPEDVAALVQQAFQNRPEVASMRLQAEAAQKFVYAERDLKRPNINVTGVAGTLPYINSGNANANIPDTYEGVAVNVQVPIFNGFLFSARRQAAQYQLVADQQRERDLLDRIAHDVRTAQERAKTSFQAISATGQLLKEANQALDLAQGRYDLGLASIVELTQAQLGQTSAQVQVLQAKYEYQQANAALQYTLGLLH